MSEARGKLSRILSAEEAQEAAERELAYFEVHGRGTPTVVRGPQPREVVIDGFVPRHQVRQWLRVRGIKWVEESLPGDRVKFGFQADEEQWSDVTAWVEKVTR